MNDPPDVDGARLGVLLRAHGPVVDASSQNECRVVLVNVA